MMKKKQKKNDKDDVVVDEDEDDYESLREQARARKLEKAKEAAKIAKEGELKSKKQQDKLDKKRKKTSGGKNGNGDDTTYDSGSDDVDVGRKRRALRAEAAADDLHIVPRGNDDDARETTTTTTTMMMMMMTTTTYLIEAWEETRKEVVSAYALMVLIAMNLQTPTNSRMAPEPKSSPLAKKCFEENNAKKSSKTRTTGTHLRTIRETCLIGLSTTSEDS